MFRKHFKRITTLLIAVPLAGLTIISEIPSSLAENDTTAIIETDISESDERILKQEILGFFIERNTKSSLVFSELTSEQVLKTLLTEKIGAESLYNSFYPAQNPVVEVTTKKNEIQQQLKAESNLGNIIKEEETVAAEGPVYEYSVKNLKKISNKIFDVKLDTSSLDIKGGKVPCLISGAAEETPECELTPIDRKVNKYTFNVCIKYSEDSCDNFTLTATKHNDRDGNYWTLVEYSCEEAFVRYQNKKISLESLPGESLHKDVVLEVGDKVSVLGSDYDWIKIKTEGHIGYVGKDVLVSAEDWLDRYSTIEDAYTFAEKYYGKDYHDSTKPQIRELRDQLEKECFVPLEEFSRWWSNLIKDVRFKNDIGVKGNNIFDWPLDDSKKITSPYGYRQDPMGKRGRVWHGGIDIGEWAGIEILAAADGVVKIATTDKSYGNYVLLQHTAKYASLYAHMSKCLVKNGERVERGQVIGYVGSTGNSTGPHLHFEIRVNGSRVDPAQYFEGL